MPQSVSRLNNKCQPDMIRDFIEHGAHDPEEFPFMEEVQALRRYRNTVINVHLGCITISLPSTNDTTLQNSLVLRETQFYVQHISHNYF